MTAIPVTWQLHGEVNEHTFTLDGGGGADLASGRTSLDLHVAPSLPEGFDVRMSQRICNFGLAAYAADGAVPVRFRDAVAQDLHIKPTRVVRIFDDAGEEIAELKALTTLKVSESGIAVVNWMTGYCHLPAAVASVEGGEHLVSTGPGTAVGVSSFRVRLDNGDQLEGLTTVPYRFDREVQVTPAVRDIYDETCTWDGEHRVRLEASSLWQPVTITAAEQV